jgi:hypothetical protein
MSRPHCPKIVPALILRIGSWIMTPEWKVAGAAQSDLNWAARQSIASIPPRATHGAL